MVIFTSLAKDGRIVLAPRRGIRTGLFVSMAREGDLNSVFFFAITGMVAMSIIIVGHRPRLLRLVQIGITLRWLIGLGIRRVSSVI